MAGLIIFAGLVAFLIVYTAWIRPWQLRWGATDAEVSRAMPGDEIVARPHFNATRAVSVAAHPEHIWPWIVQIGVTRAGWYSYDLIDNLGRPSAGKILPEFQNLQVDDIVPMSPDGKMGLYVKEINSYETMLWWDKQGSTTWAWGLYPADDGGEGGVNTTRLVTRVRLRYRWLHPSILFNLLLDVGDIIMMRKCMLGIKQRAEKLARQRA